MTWSVVFRGYNYILSFSEQMIKFSLFIICYFLRLETKPAIPLLTPQNDQTETPTNNKNWRLWGLGGRRLAFICLKSILGRWCGRRGAGCGSLAGPWALCSSVVSPPHIQALSSGRILRSRLAPCGVAKWSLIQILTRPGLLNLQDQGDLFWCGCRL